MNALDQLNAYLRRLEARLRWMAVSRGAAIAAVCALVATLLLVVIANGFAFSASSVLVARILLFLSLAAALAFGLVIPILGVNGRSAARAAEARFPAFEQRLITVADVSTPPTPFTELLAADTVNMARDYQPETLAPSARIFGLFGSAGVAAAVLLWLIAAGPGFLGYGASLLWAGTSKSALTSFYDITVQPGNKTVRRSSDQAITAQLIGFSASKARLFAQYGGASKWEQVNMVPQPGGNGYEFLFVGLAENVQYFVEAGAVQSKHYTLKVIDLPAVKKIRITYHYPKWSGMKDSTEDPGGDLRAVEGTVADVQVVTDRPLAEGVLVFGDDSQIPLEGSANSVTAKVPILKDGMYHVAAIESGEVVRLSEDFFIEARKDEPPVVKITRPGRDARVSPIEEVTVEAEGSDDFGLEELSLRYSVNGGPEKSVPLLEHRGVKSGSGKYVIALEDHHLSPGDIVSLYAAARDAQHSVKTDIFFLEAQPFEREYEQSQQAGGAGGGDQDDNKISERQKEIIAATWNQEKTPQHDARQAQEDAQFLAGTQGKLGEQAKALAERMRSRQLSSTNQEFQSFVQDMDQASAEMKAATDQLKGRKWSDAMPHEQKALQHLLRAEAVFRQIQVAFGQQGGAGGGAGGSMGRDLENLFDLELDTEKNQYETGQQGSSAADKQQQEIDKALDRLKQLAKRQQELAAQAQKEQTFRQRWEQEMLRREAEELRRQMEQLTRGENSQSSPGQQGQQNQQGQPGQQGQSSSSSSGQQGKPGQNGQSSPQDRLSAGNRQHATDPRLQQAIERLSQATDDMRKAASSQQGGSNEQNSAEQRRAADRLREAGDLLGGMRREEASQAMNQMIQQADQLSAHQQDFQNRLRQTFADGGSSTAGQSSQQNQRLAGEKGKMAEDVKQLERQMADTARQIREEQPSASTKLRNALGELQQDEVRLKMEKNADFIRQGHGSQAWMREQSVTKGLDQLRQKLRDAQASLQEKGPGQPGSDPSQAETARAFNQLENARNGLERAAREGGLQRGSQPGQSQANQPGQPGKGQPGQQPGQEGQPGSEGQTGGNQPGSRDGMIGRDGGSFGSGGGYGPAFGIDEAIRDLGQVRQTMQGSDPDASKEAQQLLQALQRLKLGNVSDPLLVERIQREILPELERLELQLRRKLDDANAGQIRTGGPEQVPNGYADSVAEYFRRLSKSK